ncbi:mORN repeat protein [Fusobacterium sp. CAG:649]|nr:MORN repeat protein [Fusobacterium sp. CAG:649]CDA07455.1 mORN repeat protein [Fusobacterium sp. CAG:649]
MAFAAGEKRVPIEKMELNQQTSMVYLQGQQTPFTGTVEKKYASGKLEATMEFKNGKLQLEIPYKNGQVDGLVKRYDENGQVVEQATFKNGQEVKTK